MSESLRKATFQRASFSTFALNFAELHVTNRWPDDATHDALIGDWWIYQRKRGHRTSTDDVLTALTAAWVSAGNPIESYLDLGCGIGSVLLLTAHSVRPQTCLGVEAQEVSVQLAARSIQELPDQAPTVSVQHGDIRNTDCDEIGTFDLITGSPPYLPFGTGVLPDDPQRRACRFELRGGVEVYLKAADRLLSDDGVFVCVFQSRYAHRVAAAVSDSGLVLRKEFQFRMKEDREEPFLSTFVVTRSERSPLAAIVDSASGFAIRDSEGEWTREYRGAREFMGFDP